MPAIEQGRIRPAISRRARNYLESIKDRAIYSAITLTGPIVRLGEENISRTTTIEYPEGFWPEYIRNRLDDCIPIDVSNHTVHQDANSMAEIADDQVEAERRFLPKRSRLKGSQIPLAMSVTNGDQGPVIHALYAIDYPQLAKRHLTPLLLTRSKDVEKYNAQKKESSR